MAYVFVGTYIDKNALSKFDFTNGKLCHIKSYYEPMYCSYLQFKNHKLYVLCENKKWDNGFLIILNDNNINKISSYGINPCYINVGEDIVVCNYSSENVCIFDNSYLKYKYHI